MIIKITPDIQKSKALIEMARITLQRLNTTDIYKYPSNTLTDYYDIIHKLMESLALSKGIKIKGEGAHQELIDYVCKVHNLGESVRILLQEIRDYRNRTSYEGFMVNENYIKQNISRIRDILSSLSKLLDINL